MTVEPSENSRRPVDPPPSADPLGSNAAGKEAHDGDDGKSVLSHVRRLLGFEPGVQLRSLTTGSALSFDESQEEGKYLIERVIGEGGMGKVYLAFDRDLKRHVALKVIKNQQAVRPEQLARFVEEAQITGQLEHPCIPAVHELAINQNEEVFFTLKLLRGRTLKELIHELHIGRRDTRERFSRTRLIQILQQVANAVHFAHEKGVIHRDIKPENIMVGDYGEVQLMDWGLAKALGQPRRREFEADPPESRVETVRTEQNLETLEGVIQGTLQYMAPEQAHGRAEFVDRRTDVWSLGATLYEALTFLPPKTGTSTQELLEETRLGLVLPPGKRAPKQRIPAELEEICLKALEYHPDDRYQTALELAEALQVYLDGTLERERRRRECDGFLREAIEVLREYETAKRERKRLEENFERLDEGAGHHPSVDTKRQLRELRREREASEITVARLYTQVQTLLAAALVASPSDTRARRALGELYLERFLEADRDGDKKDAIFYRGLIEQVNDGSFDRVLDGSGRLTVKALRADAALTLLCYEEKDAILVADRVVAEARGALALDQVAMGSYLVAIDAPGIAPVRLPVRVARNAEIRLTVRLFSAASIPEDFCFVPAGEFQMFGDPNVLSTLADRREMHVPDYAIARFPVTCGDYLRFLEALAAEDPDEARGRSPRESEQSGWLWIDDDDRLALPDSGRYQWHANLPVFGVSFDDARAYCRWLSARDGREYDLPTEAEWEKAARGVDGRHYAWGNNFDNEFANNLHASAERDAGVASVDSFPIDCSPYGVRGVVGNVSEFCRPVAGEREGLVAVRGGNWALTGDPCRLAARRVTDERYVSDRIGFRVKLYPGPCDG